MQTAQRRGGEAFTNGCPPCTVQAGNIVVSVAFNTLKKLLGVRKCLVQLARSGITNIFDTDFQKC